MNSQRPRSITMRFLAQPNTINFGGKVHGGTVMSWIDQAAYACATGWSQSYCVTAYVGGIRFVRPIIIGDVVEVNATLTYTGSTSMNIAVEVHSGDLKGSSLEKTTECAVVMVSVDSHGRPMPVVPFLPNDDTSKALADEVKKRLSTNAAFTTNS
jgi:acyl-CoA hydrolase